MRNEIKNKMDEHIKELLAKPSISNEDYSLLREKLAELPADRKWSDPFMLMLLVMIFSGFGGAENGV